MVDWPSCYLIGNFISSTYYDTIKNTFNLFSDLNIAFYFHKWAIPVLFSEFSSLKQFAVNKLPTAGFELGALPAASQ